MKSKLKKILLDGLFLVLCVSVAMYFILRGQDFDALIQYIVNSSQSYWFIGLALVIAFILCESVIIFYLLGVLDEKPKLSHCFLYSFVGFFFSLVTPTASGGQPMQLVFMKKDNLRMSRCIPVLLLVTITYKAVLILIGLIVMVLRPASIMPLLEPAMPWINLGMVLNVLCVGGMLALVLMPNITRSFAFGSIKLASHFIKPERAERWRIQAERSMSSYAETSTYFKGNVKPIMVAMGITIVQRCLLFAVTYVVLLSFDIDALNLIQTVLLQGSISLSADMLPLPGGLGISEHLYNIIFEPACGPTLTAATLVISRGLSFYAQLLVSALMTAVAYIVIIGTKAVKE